MMTADTRNLMTNTLYTQLKEVWRKGYKIKKIKEEIPELTRETDKVISRLFGEVLNNEWKKL